MQGRELIFQKIKGEAVASVIVGLIIGGVAAGFAAYILKMEWGHLWGSFFTLFLCLTGVVSGIALLVVGIRQLRDPMKAGCFKSNPDLLIMAEELYGNVIYGDEYLLLSPRILGSTADPRQMAFTDEIFLIYIYRHKTNGIPDQKLLKCETARGTIAFNVFRKKDPEIDRLVGTVMQNCRYARVGYTKEGLAYLEQMRKLWRADQERKKSDSIS